MTAASRRRRGIISVHHDEHRESRAPNLPLPVQPPSSAANCPPHSPCRPSRLPTSSSSSSQSPSIHPECLICCVSHPPSHHLLMPSFPSDLRHLQPSPEAVRQAEEEGGGQRTEKKATEDVEGGSAMGVPLLPSAVGLRSSSLVRCEVKRTDHSAALALQHRTRACSSYLYDESIDTFFQDVSALSQSVPQAPLHLLPPL